MLVFSCVAPRLRGLVAWTFFVLAERRHPIADSRYLPRNIPSNPVVQSTETCCWPSTLPQEGSPLFSAP